MADINMRPYTCQSKQIAINSRVQKKKKKNPAPGALKKKKKLVTLNFSPVATFS